MKSCTVDCPPPVLPASAPDATGAACPRPIVEDPDYRSTEKLHGKVAIITGGCSGIGKAVAILFAKEGADLCLIYLDEHDDAEATAQRIREIGQRVVLISCDVGDSGFCSLAVERTLAVYGRIDILVNNAARQRSLRGVEDLNAEQVRQTFATNLFGCFYLSRAVMPHLRPGACIINTTSAQAYDPLPVLMDYACAKAALSNFTLSLAKEGAPRGIRVNAVAPGPIWTRMIHSTLLPEHLKVFGHDVLLGRAGQPAEVAPSFVFLASDRDSSYMTGQTLHPNGG